MNSAHKWLISGLSLFLIFYSSFVVWYYFEKSSLPASEPELAQNVSDQGGKVLAGGGPNINVYIKDASTQQFVSDAVVIFVSPRDPVDYCYNTNWTFSFYAEEQIYWMKCLLKAGQSPPAGVNISISKNGYETKNAILHDSSYWSYEGTVYINKAGTTPTTTTQNTGRSSQETIKSVALPSVFTATGSTTTSLSSIKDPKNINNLTLDVVGKNKVIFSDSIDLSSPTAKDLFKQLDSYVRMSAPGIVSIDSSVLSMLANKKAVVSMLNLPFIETPTILVNGKVVTNKVVSGITYKNRTLSFNVTGFSKYEVVPKLTIIEPKNGLETSKREITLRGKITDPTATVSAKLNGQSLGKLKVATASGEFSTTLKLAKGANTIRVEALSKFGPPLVATASAVFKPLISSEMIIIGGIGLVLILIVVIVWWYYKKRKSKIISTI